ncbi:hypothetical protein GCM10009827_055500 [Dactylosporangium maewongense]|uniref:DUF4259 domain-containing protein n=1 Tax=Dactylosporangium maewongense TaxID=634393 RepID=A0ABN2B0E3_9ACTN
MSFWDGTPFGNDAAADFAGELDEAAPEQRVAMVGELLTRTAATTDADIASCPGGEFGVIEAARAVAAAALVAAQREGGEPIHGSYGPTTAMPPFPRSFTGLAVDALDRITATQAWHDDDWADPENAPAWRRTVLSLRKVLDPPQRETLFDL